MIKIPLYDLEEAADPRGRGTKRGRLEEDPVNLLYKPSEHFLGAVKRAYEVGIAPPENDSPLAIMEFETRFTIRREFDRKGLLKPNWDI